MTTPEPQPLLHESVHVGAARLATRHRGRFSTETVQALILDSYQRLAATARVTAHLNVLAERLAAERLDALASIQQAPDSRSPRVLFVCTQNSGRSQIAAALLAHHATGPVTVSSAGTEPVADVESDLARVLHEVGVDLGPAYPKPLTQEVVEAADIVVTLGCGDACPVVPGKRYLDWPTADPHGASLEDLRHIRDTIDTHVGDLVAFLASPSITTETK
ncbi:arsenate-mycothiol transferase ArsC [Nocardiopsis deserti]|uniref:arsenate-mycothiol transferase ArsC n=1 Tax=Nocardiopsis deserti TaxID=2605988 RepID=UPI00123A03C6|nr:arsenate reductase ArsC [Nocardiopsis deserti]